MRLLREAASTPPAVARERSGSPRWISVPFARIDAPRRAAGRLTLSQMMSSFIEGAEIGATIRTEAGVAKVDASINALRIDGKLLLDQIVRTNQLLEALVEHTTGKPAPMPPKPVYRGSEDAGRLWGLPPGRTPEIPAAGDRTPEVPSASEPWQVPSPKKSD